MKSKLIILLTLVPFSSFSTGNNFEINKTRVIYSDSTPSVQISNNKAYPLIIQSNVWDESNNKNHDFIATPPI
ncbi:molecular chaperone, partial [Escherichia coli]|nr:molecular chaperone [Escherichia coli]